MSALEQLAKKLEAEVDAELADPSVPAHHHGRPIGYNNGCKGPLCRKQQRDRLRRKGSSPANPWADEYLEARLTAHRESLKEKKEKVA